MNLRNYLDSTGNTPSDGGIFALHCTTAGGGVAAGAQKKREPKLNVIKIVALAEDGKPEEMSTSETVCSFS